MARLSFQAQLLLAVLVLMTAWYHTTDAAFTEYFGATERNHGSIATPFLWVEHGDMEHGGRPAPDGQNSMMLADFKKFYYPPKNATTELLSWDGSNTTLSFFYFVQAEGSFSGNCPDTPPQVQLSWSTNRMNWTLLWNDSLSWYDVNQWHGVRVRLPVSAATPQFALKWVNTDRRADKTDVFTPIHHECTRVYIDNIVFPAKPPTAENLGQGLNKADGPLAQDSLGCETCKDVCLSLLQREAEDRAAVGNVLGRPGLGG